MIILLVLLLAVIPSCGPPELIKRPASSNVTASNTVPQVVDGNNDPDSGPETQVPDMEPEIKISEIFYDALESDTDGHLFVELNGEAESDISGYQIVFVNGADGKITEQETLPEGTFIGGDGLFVMADLRNGGQAGTYVTDFDLLADFDPQNGPDSVQVVGRSGALMDAVCYGDPPVKTAANGLPMCNITAPDGMAGTSVALTEDGNFVVNKAPSPGSSAITPE